MALRIAVTAEPIPSHVSALDFVMARAVRRTVAAFRTTVPERPDRPASSRPLVYVSLGTLTTAMSGLRGVVRSVYREVMAALSATGCEAIVSAGHLARDLPSAGPRITVVEHVPQPTLLRQVDLFVTHGGRASLLDAVQAATPVLGLGVLADQPGNTTAFAGHGLGRALELTATRDEIADTVTALLADSRYAAAMAAADAELSRLPPLDIAELRACV
ncbi:glycosyltransferase [Kitasatospora sp. NPDC001261]|uniref:glycosyltransferase n=1 Tax=Kitasatospora sp. NPDC001261 TaxID=3364012 RepID=UPI0036817736